MRTAVPARGPRPHNTRARARTVREAVCANVRLRFPARRLPVIGVTGTDGKTTTCNFIAAMLEAAGHRVGLISTAVLQVGTERRDQPYRWTTPAPWELQRLLRHMVSRRMEWVVLEVSSHALDQRRVLGVPFHAAVVTNISRAHLGYHGDMKSYIAAKSRLFRTHPALAVFNAGDPLVSRLDRFPAGTKLYYGTPGADVRALDVHLAARSSGFRLETPVGAAEVHLRLPGHYNIDNALAAAAAGIGLGVSLSDVVRGLEQLTSLPGRMEWIDGGQPFDVVVDFAHTPNGLVRLCQALRNVQPGRLIVVVGGTGNNDPGERRSRAEVATRLCDAVVLTCGEPLWEAEGIILADLQAGATQSAGTARPDIHIVPDRRAAIETALRLAGRGDTVAVAGLGHQRYRQRQGVLEPWDDRTVVRELLLSLGFHPSPAGRLPVQ
ncbi:MAG: Mur ligase family protein [Candidatus Dormibacteria bacterium]